MRTRRGRACLQYPAQYRSKSTRGKRGLNGADCRRKAVRPPLEEIIQPVELEAYGSFEQVARTRLASRDLDDWPVLTTALALSSPIWAGDNVFFGAGVATWTTDRVELFLVASPPITRIPQMQ
ncbi:MAG: PIN domain-containing protein [Bryobacteraceae bacterium]